MDTMSRLHYDDVGLVCSSVIPSITQREIDGSKRELISEGHQEVLSSVHILNFFLAWNIVSFFAGQYCIVGRAFSL